MRTPIISLAIAVAAASLYVSAENRAEEKSPPRFRDITEAAGVTFVHNSAPEKKYIVESMSGGVALFDYDNDGCLDIYFTNALTVDTANDAKKSRSALYHNDCKGHFIDVTDKAGVGYPGWAHGVVAADFDGDGYEDLYVTSLGHNHLYHNNGDGTFSDVTQHAGADDTRWSTGAAAADYDKDGAVDLFVSNYVDIDLGKLPEFGKTQFCRYRGVAVQCGPKGLPGAGDSLFRNNGDGTFRKAGESAGLSDKEGRYGLGAVWTDVDGDGWLDLFVANDATGNYLYRNNHDGTFKELGLEAGVSLDDDGVPLGSMGVGVGDYLHTGQFGIFITNFSGEHATLYRHDRPWLFTDVSYASKVAPISTPYVGWGAGFFDYDNDGWPDVIAVNGHVYPQMENASVGTTYRQRILLFHNEKAGTFSEVASEAGSALMTPRVGRGVAFGDIDNDGAVDVVINNLDGKPTVLRNESGGDNHWITVKLAGKGLNRDAIGARVKATSGDLAQWDEVHAGGSYLSSSDMRLHFGLGTRTSVDDIEVHWPDGKVEKVQKIAANNFLTITEGSGITGMSPAKVNR